MFVLKLQREFVLGLSVTSTGSKEDRLRWSFRLYDIRRDGVIREEEMVKVVQAIFSVFGECEAGKEVSAEDTANDIFSKMDTDKNGYISEEEFIKCCMEESIFNLFSNKVR